MIGEQEYQHHLYCQTYGHGWRATSQRGTYQCRNCQVRGYCPGCLSLVPLSLIPMRCARHGEKREEGKQDA